MGMEGKVALITDGASPSGAALARAYAAQGARVAVNFSRRAEGPAVFDGVTRYQMDITTGDGPEKLVAQVVGDAGGLDILVHNNNRPVIGALERSTDEQLRDIMDYNAKSAFFMTQAAGRHMKNHGGGSILYISSIHGEKPTGSTLAYGMAKAAVKMLAKETVLDLGGYGIRANVIEMGPVAGDEHLFQSDTSRLYDNLHLKIPGGVTGSWDDAARLAVFLTGDDCPYVNGESITVDGGFLLHYFYRKNYEEWQGDFVHG